MAIGLDAAPKRYSNGRKDDVSLFTRSLDYSQLADMFECLVDIFLRHATSGIAVNQPWHMCRMCPCALVAFVGQ